MKKNPEILIIGLGLLGSSLAMALKHAGIPCAGWARRAELRARALAEGTIARTGDRLPELLGEARLTVLALPIPATVEFIRRYGDCWRPGSIVTDVASVKKQVMQAAMGRLLPNGVHFVGSHPMAGTEFSGYDAGRADLYDNADVFVLRPAQTPEDSARKVEEFWKSVKCHPRRIAVEEHDRLVANSSHALHILAAALSVGVLGVPEGGARELRFAGCAGGFRDTSRIASSNPVMWREIIESNRDEVLFALDAFEKELKHFRGLIEENDFDGFEREFARGRDLRRQWLDYRKENAKK